MGYCGCSLGLRGGGDSSMGQGRAGAPPCLNGGWRGGREGCSWLVHSAGWCLRLAGMARCTMPPSWLLQTAGMLHLRCTAKSWGALTARAVNARATPSSGASHPASVFCSVTCAGHGALLCQVLGAHERRVHSEAPHPAGALLFQAHNLLFQARCCLFVCLSHRQAR